MPVCIIGMHRSGTSMVAKLLHHCGLYLGEDGDFLEAGPHNPRGYWEHRDIVELNDDILAALGGGWDFPPSLANGWEMGEDMKQFVERAGELGEGLSRRESWGWKDPRTALTLPLWRLAISDLNVVVCVRHPLEVLESLAARAPCSAAFGLGLWLTYYESSLANTEGTPRLITHYDSYFGNGGEELTRVARGIGLSVEADAARAAIDEVAPGLRHHSESDRDLVSSEVPLEVIACYAALCSEAGRRDGILSRPEPAGEGNGVGTRGVLAAQRWLRGKRDAWRATGKTPLDSREQRLAAQLTQVRESYGKARESFQARRSRLEQRNLELAETIHAMRSTRAWRLAQRYRRVRSRLGRSD